MGEMCMSVYVKSDSIPGLCMLESVNMFIWLIDWVHMCVCVCIKRVCVCVCAHEYANMIVLGMLGHCV